MRTNILGAIFTLVLAMIAGCDGQTKNAGVVAAMNSLEEQLAKNHEPPFSGTEAGLVDAWGGIPVSDLPVDFQLAWSNARTAYIAAIDGTTPGGAQAYMQAINHLEIVASQYDPRIRKRRKLLEDMSRLLMQVEHSPDFWRGLSRKPESGLWASQLVMSGPTFST